jgi:ParB family chromosome partitioning protein
MTELVMLTLKQLELDKQNQRLTYDQKGIEALAASIKAQGLIVPLVVRQGSKDRYSVVDGKRRFLALQELNDPALKVACVVREDLNLQDGMTAAVSLAANVVREPMNPADEVRAFVHLRDVSKKTPPEIAALFGITHQRVRQRLAIGETSPLVVDALRQGAIAPDVAAAFTASSDHKAQEEVLKSLTQQTWGRTAENVRNALRRDAITGTSALAKIVGRKAYEKAGGKVRHDLFDNVLTFEDAGLLRRLANEKFAKVAARLKAQGWSWVAFKGDEGIPDDASYSWPSEVPSGPLKLSKEKQKRLDALEEKDELSDDEDQEASQIREDAMAERYTKAQRAKCGVLIDPERGQMRYGIMKPSDKKAELKKEAKAKAKKGNGHAPPLSNSLADDLADCLAGGVQMSLAEQPGLAEAVLIAQLILNQRPVEWGNDAKGPLSLRGAVFDSELPENLGHKDFAASFKALLKDAPMKGYFEPLVDWVLKRKPAVRAALLAHCAAIYVRSTRGYHGGGKDAEQLVKLVKPKMARWWKPTQHDQLQRFSREQLIAFMKEVAPKSKDDWSKQKRAVLAKAVAKAAEPSGWVPKELR